MDWLQLFAPAHVIIHLGGNDLTVKSIPRALGDKVLSLVKELKLSGVRSVLV